MNRQLINGDCLEELKKLDDNSVDLLCTDQIRLWIYGQTLGYI